MLSTQTKHGVAFGRKISRDHLLFTGIIVASVLVACNFKCEDVVSFSKLDGQLRQSARTPPFYSHVLVLTVHLEGGDVLYHLHQDGLVQYVPLACHGTTLVEHSAS